MKMMRIPTNELEIKIKDGYSKLQAMAEKDGIYIELDILFSEKLPINFEGIYVYSDDGGYHYASIERGMMNMHRITDNLFEISYWIYSHITFWMSVNFERNNRIDNQDARRLIFKKRLELLSLVGENYRKRGEIDIDETLINNPYNDTIC